MTPIHRRTPPAVLPDGSGTVQPEAARTAVGLPSPGAEGAVEGASEDARHLSHVKVGRRNRYEVHASLPLRHPLEDHLEIGALLRVLIERG